MKNTPTKCGVFFMVGYSDVRWNTVEASLVLMYIKMRDLGFYFDGEKIIIADSVEAGD
jgi:hypothetical protein